MDESALRDQARRLVAGTADATATADNESTLRHKLESLLEEACLALSIPWAPLALDATLRSAGGVSFVDAAHGAIVLEYEPPRSFRGRSGAKLREARRQAAEYAHLLSEREGRPSHEYRLVAWDGSHIDFGIAEPEGWEGPKPFDQAAAERLLRQHASDGVALVHPDLLAQIVGPESNIGQALIPLLFDAIVASDKDEGVRSTLLFREWQRLFGQVSGVQSERLRDFIAQLSRAHARDYSAHPSHALFALYTYLALVAKVVAAASLTATGMSVTDASVPVKRRIEDLETGKLFEAAGIANMLSGDFFSWYVHDPAWNSLAPDLERLLSRLSDVSFDMSRKNPSTTRDLFKGLYESFVPSALRHALGEFYTPDDLASHALAQVGWSPADSLTDPTCGSGTFLLEALKQRLTGTRATAGADELLDGLAGTDLNPLAVLCARASLVVFLSDRFDPGRRTRIPVFLADAVHPTQRSDAGNFRNVLQTERGEFAFELNESIVNREAFFSLFERIRVLLEEGLGIASITDAACEVMAVDASEERQIEVVVTQLCELRDVGWDGIWCAILADRFAAAALPPASFVAGNPPWVKWSNLPPEYASLIKPACIALGVFSEDTWVGGIESDISTVITFEAVRSRLVDGGRLAFFITGTVFANESSQGFRRFAIPGTGIRMRVLAVEDFEAVRPFEGVSNHPTLLLLERGAPTEYPVDYTRWRRDEQHGHVADRRLATPVPGTDAGPWLIGTEVEHEVWRRIFGANHPRRRARKGVTTDLNGVWWLHPLSRHGDLVKARNEPTRGRKEGVPRREGMLEEEHLFPLLRGKDVGAFSAQVDDDYVLLAPQRHMHGDPELATVAPQAHHFLTGFRDLLKNRSSYRRYQRGKPYWSLWSLGPYSFAPYKVVWKEMSGRRFAAAYIGPVKSGVLDEKPVLCDHKLYFVPCDIEEEAAFLAGLLNAPSVTAAINAYASQLSLGVSVVEYLDLPKFDQGRQSHREIVELAKGVTRGSIRYDNAAHDQLDTIARGILSL